VKAIEFPWVSRQFNHKDGTRGCCFRTIKEHFRTTKMDGHVYNVFGTPIKWRCVVLI